VALLPEPFLGRLATGRVDAVRIVAPELRWRVAQVRHGNYLSHAARAWLRICQDVLR
jgi:hypothetical protein